MPGVQSARLRVARRDADPGQDTGGRRAHGRDDGRAVRRSSPGGGGRSASSRSPAPTAARFATSASSSPAGWSSSTTTAPRLEVGPGDAYVIEPGHDAWVVGDERFVGFEFESRVGRGVRQGLDGRKRRRPPGSLRADGAVSDEAGGRLRHARPLADGGPLGRGIRRGRGLLPRRLGGRRHGLLNGLRGLVAAAPHGLRDRRCDLHDLRRRRWRRARGLRGGVLLRRGRAALGPDGLCAHRARRIGLRRHRGRPRCGRRCRPLSSGAR